MLDILIVMMYLVININTDGPANREKEDEMDNFVGYWISIVEECGELIDESNEDGSSNLYLNLAKEWWSSDGNVWERQPDRYVVFTYGTMDSIGVYEDLDAIAKDFDRPSLEIDMENHSIAATWWAVDSGHVQRGFELDVLPCDDEEFDDLWKRAQKEDC